jgi:hypothetical protein
MSKKIHVLFRNNDATVFTNEMPSKVKKSDIVLTDPDLSRVQGVSPHNWKLVADKYIFPMNAAERAIKNATHRKHYKTHKGYNWSKMVGRVLYSVGILLIGFAVGYYLTKTGRIK